MKNENSDTNHLRVSITHKLDLGWFFPTKLNQAYVEKVNNPYGTHSQSVKALK